MIPLTKYVFVDMDETLFHARFISSNLQDAETSLKPDEKLISCTGEYYGSKLRPGALEFLAKLRAIRNCRVLVLTSSISEYANQNNLVHNLGFDPNDIYSRENLHEGSDDVDFGDGPKEMYLIDNLSRHENRIKIRWIDNICQDAELLYVKVPEYWGGKDDFPFNEGIVDSIMNTITGE